MQHLPQHCQADCQACSNQVPFVVVIFIGFKCFPGVDNVGTITHLKSFGDACDLGSSALLVFRLRLRELFLLALRRQRPCWQHQEQHRQKLENKHAALAEKQNAENQTWDVIAKCLTVQMRQQRTVDKLTSRGQPGMLMIVGWSGWITTSKTRTTHKKEKQGADGKRALSQGGSSPATVGGSGTRARRLVGAHSHLKRYCCHPGPPSDQPGILCCHQPLTNNPHTINNHWKSPSTPLSCPFQCVKVPSCGVGVIH